MPAYVISEVEILDEESAAQYRRFAEASISAYGGRYLARAAVPEVAEGQSTSRRIVIVEFPSMERIHEWYESAEYATALEYRDAGIGRRMMFVEGLGA